MTHCQALSLVFTTVVIPWHSLSLDVPLIYLFINDLNTACFNLLAHFYSVSTIYIIIKGYYKRLFYINEIQEAIIAIMHILYLIYSIQLNEIFFHLLFYEVCYLKWSNLENCTSNNTTQDKTTRHDTTRDNTTQDNTTQKDATRIAHNISLHNTSATRVQHETTRVKYDTTRVLHNPKFYFDLFLSLLHTRNLVC